MKRRVNIGVGCLFLLVGWLISFTLNSTLAGYEIHILGPTLLLAIGLGLVWKSGGGKISALALAFTALLALLIMNQIQPERALSVPAIKKRFHGAAVDGQPVIVDVPSVFRPEGADGNFQLEVFPEIEITHYAQLPGPPHDIVFDPAGRMFVSIPDLGAVYVIPANARLRSHEPPVLFYADLDRPSGLAWYAQTLYVAEPGQVVALQDNDNDDVADSVNAVLVDLPDDGGHWTRAVAVGNEGHLYVGVGSRCNACDEVDSRRGTVLKVDPVTGAAQIYAKGLRNVGGLVFDAGLLWGSENGRVGSSSGEIPDEINLLVEGGDFGWPYCVGRNLTDSEIISGEQCLGKIPSQLELPPASAPLGLVFGSQLHAPSEYKSSLYVALNDGSGGHPGRIIRISFEKGMLSGEPFEFARQALQGSSQWQPVALTVGPDGALFVSDEATGGIYRISWQEVEQKKMQ